MPSIDITLSRAHKIAERLRSKAGELASEASQCAASANVSGRALAMSERMASQASKAMELSEASERMLRACAEVRAAIGRENDRRGIGALLARSSAVNGALGAVKSMLDQAKDGSMPLAELEGYQPLGSDAYGVRVNMFSDAQRAALQARADKLQREAFLLADQVAEANAARFALELPQEALAAATGA